MTFVIEDFEPAFAEQTARVWEAGWHDAHAAHVPAGLTRLRTYDSFLERIQENAAQTRLALGDERVLGLSITRADELYQFYVAPEARGTGLAQALIQDAEARIRAEGQDVAWLACAIGNDRARRFYEKCAWTCTRTEVVDLDTSAGPFPLQLWRLEKELSQAWAGARAGQAPGP